VSQNLGAEPRVRMRRTRCATNRTDRALYAVAAVFTASAAAATIDNLWCAIPAALCTIALTVAAITGWCPAALLPVGRTDSRGTTFGFPDARGSIRL
jgi:hypothetical protein